MCAFPKPGAIKIPKGAVKVFPDGREVCQVDTKAGWEEYKRRVKIMWERQGKRCGLVISPQCKERGGRLLLAEAQFDHSNGRGMGGGKRTDAIVDKDGNPMNMAVCVWCNSLKSSRPLSDFINEIIP